MGIKENQDNPMETTDWIKDNELEFLLFQIGAFNIEILNLFDLS